MQSKLIDFSKYSSLRIGGAIEVGVVECVDDWANNGVIIGKANNLLVSPNAKNLYILGKSFDYFQDFGDLIEVGGGVSSGKLYSYFKKQDLGGLEFLRGLPGSVGGLVKMNAGMKEYEICLSIHSVLLDQGWVPKEEIAFDYRNSGIDSVIYAVRFYKQKGFREELVEVFDKMRHTHPKEPSCGSCFKNPKGDFAGRLLESVGLRGYSIGGVGFSQKHSNFLVNLGGGTFDEAMELIALAKKRVSEASGIELECEVVVIDSLP
ncbi:UDP-N-acetylenolpyruvoylglucosamine reductase [Helicobacter enhydrae]|uniref:UDP-N-acetylenolpyruvoylglucosamine reductase n=1 Tax=Helicobacter enhydrae TaxID=222136 RepID=A0A1B1U3Z3_9HELI|nr:UDP-N-acetylmuramate dehydrogenase [Helicobacter enhydrae]ANV97461.1 UDP-N-acetylenolpyruvoylglucosamine reductase [Helicobacter enhydrae]